MSPLDMSLAARWSGVVGADGPAQLPDPAKPSSYLSNQTELDAAMERYANGEEDAFEIVYDGLAPRLLRFLRRQARDDGRAEDLLQQTFLQIVAARASFLSGARVTPWAFAIARRLLIDADRKGRRQVRIANDEEVDAPGSMAPAPGADQVAHARRLAAQVQVELARMPESQRVAFELTRLDGLSLAEASELLGTTPNAVKVRVFRASEALRAVLGDVVERDWST